MIKIDLEKALAGDKVVTRGGVSATQIHLFKLDNNERVITGVVNGELVNWSDDGKEYNSFTDEDLFMAPKKLSGFVNIYDGSANTYHESFDRATQYARNQSKLTRLACIDLSQFKEGHGL